MVRLDHRHHAFIQALMARGPLSEKDCKEMFGALIAEENQEAAFLQFITSINKELDFLQMELKASTNQYNGVVYFGIVNKLASEQAKLGTRYSHAQIGFFKALLEAIATLPASEGKISSIDALNLRIDAQNEERSSQTSTVAVNLTLAQKEKTLTELVNDKWLATTEEGMVALGVRSFLELGSVFKNLDVHFCDVCNEAGIKARPCQNEECPVRIHDYCLQRKFHNRQVARVCSRCGSDWDGGDRVSHARDDVVLSIDIPTLSPECRKPRTRHRSSRIDKAG